MSAFVERALSAVLAGCIVSLSAGCVSPTTDFCGDETDVCPSGERCLRISGVEQCHKTCADSPSCSDSSPLCDDALKVCRECFPGEDALCQARNASTPRCVKGRCAACRPPSDVAAESSECGVTSAAISASPVCDPRSYACRPCLRHSECASGICVKDGSDAELGIPRGACVPSKQVLVVDQDLCSGTGPSFCTLKQAIAKLDADHRYILLRKGVSTVDFNELQIGMQTSHKGQILHIVGPLADQSPSSIASEPRAAIGGSKLKDGLTVTQSSVFLDGVLVRGNHVGVQCTGAEAKLSLVRSYLTGNDTAIMASAGCRLSVTDSWLGRGPNNSTFRQATGNIRGIEISGSDFSIVNTVFSDNGDFRQDGFGGVRVRSLSTGTRRSTIVNSTIYQTSGLLKLGKYFTSLLCDTAVGDRLVVMNTLLLGDSNLQMTPEEHYVDPTCGAVISHVASNDSALGSGQSVVLPMGVIPLRNAAERDLRPVAPGVSEGPQIQTAGAVQVEVSGERIVAPTTDLDGRSRPQSAVAIGAFEPVP